MKTIKYIIDPHCGWCFGNSDNALDIYQQFKSEFNFELLVGGMWLGEQAPKGGTSFSQFISAHAPRMMETTGAKLPEPFYKLTRDETYTFSSLEPCAAIVAIKQLAPHRAFEFAHEVHSAIFVDGSRLDDISSYIPVLENLDIDVEAFAAMWTSDATITATLAEFETARTMARGFPTLAIDSGGDSVELLTSGYFEVEAIASKLEQFK